MLIDSVSNPEQIYFAPNKSWIPTLDAGWALGSTKRVLSWGQQARMSAM